MITNLVLTVVLSFTRVNGLNGYGDRVFGDATWMALGGAFYHNPAFVRFSGISVELNLPAAVTSERWTRPAYDRFGSTVGQLTEYSFQHSSLSIPDFAISYADGKKFASISREKLYDLSYRYDRVFRSDYYTIEGFHSIEQTGDVSRIGISFGYRFQKGKFGVDAGLGISQYTIKKDYSETRGYADGTIDSTSRELELSKVAPSAGIVFRVGYRAAVGLSYRLPLEFVGDSDSVSYPGAFSVSMRLTPPSKITTNVFFNYTYDGNLHYSLGFEHEIITGEWIRFGGGVSENLKTLRWNPYFAFGFGHRASHVGVDAGFTFTPYNYRLYAYGNSYSAKEWIFRSSLSLTLNF